MAVGGKCFPTLYTIQVGDAKVRSDSNPPSKERERFMEVSMLMEEVEGPRLFCDSLTYICSHIIYRELHPNPLGPRLSNIWMRMTNLAEIRICKPASLPRWFVFTEPTLGTNEQFQQSLKRLTIFQHVLDANELAWTPLKASFPFRLSISWEPASIARGRSISHV